MPDHQNLEKVPWPGDWAIFSAGAKNLGLTNDASGEEAIDRWATTATPEELDALLGPIGPDGQRQYKKGRAYSLGFFSGLATYPLWDRFWSWLFGNRG